jgi:hypothetical protein
MKFCPAQCLDGEIDADGKQLTMRYDMYKCADFSEQYDALPQIIEAAIAAHEEPGGPAATLYDPDASMLWYKMSVGSGGLLAQCFECMRVCPLATQAPLADPIRRSAAKAAVEDGA